MKTCRAKFGPNVVVVGDPVDVVTGANLDQQTDFVLAGPLPLAWCRWYDSSQNEVPGELGWGHRHGCERRLVFDLDGCRHVGPGGGAATFPPLEQDGDEFAADGFRLTRVSDAVYRLFQPGEPEAEFEVIDGRPVGVLSALIRGDHRIRFHYDRDARLNGITDSKGRSIRVEYDGYGRLARLSMPGSNGHPKRLAEYEYDAAGNLVKAIDPYNHAVRLRWDAANRVVWRADRRGYAFRFEYDELGRCVLAGGEDGTDEVRLDYRPAEQLTRVTNPDGGVWVYRYDDDGVVTSITAPDGGVRAFVTDEAGRVVSEVDPLGNVIRREYDSAGGEAGRWDGLGHQRDDDADNPLEDPVPMNPAEWELGQLLPWESIDLPRPGDPVLDRLAAERPYLHLQPAGLPQAGLEADEFGVVSRERFPDGTSRSWGRDANGNVVRYTDRDGATTRTEYRGWNLTGVVTDPAGGRQAFEHDRTGRLVRYTDPGGTTSEYAFDTTDRLVEVRRHGRVRERYEYDLAGNLTGKFDPHGRPLARYEIGPHGLPRSRTLGSGEVHTYEYDFWGRCVAARDGRHAYAFAFDREGRRVGDLRDGLGVTYQYNPDGSAACVVLGRFPFEYQWTDVNELTVRGPTGAATVFRYLNNGVMERTAASGTREVSQFDPDGRCLARVVTLADGPTRGTAYRYSGEGDLLEARNGAGTTRYRYDPNHRLAEVAHLDGTAITFDRDPAGTVVGQRDAAGQPVPLPRIPERDARGNAVRGAGEKSAAFRYDDLDRLVAVESADGPGWEAGYDPFGRRVWKAWGDNRVEYYWDGDRVAAEVVPGGRVRVYAYTDPYALQPFAFVDYPAADSPPDAGRCYWVHCDHLSAPAEVEDGQGRVVWAVRRGVFGRPDPLAAAIDYAMSWPGHQHDPETGLNYNRFRSYCPDAGVYLQSDPMGIGGGYNLTAYCDGNPVSYVDVLGLARSGKKTKAPKGGKTTEDAEPPAEHPEPGSKAEDDLYKRGKFRKKAKEDADARAPRNRDGTLRCETCGKPIPKKVTISDGKGGKKKVSGKHYDHYPDTWAKRVAKFKRQKRPPTRKQVLDEYNRRIRAICAPCNLCHKYEGKRGKYAKKKRKKCKKR